MSRPFATAGLAVTVCLLAACAPEPPPEAEPANVPLSTVDVAPAPDATADLSRDTLGRVAGTEAVAGVLPGGFPKDLPLPSGTSIVDLGESEGSSYLTLRSTAPRAAMAARLPRALTAAGWALSQEGGAWRLVKAGRKVSVRLVDADPGCEIRYEYQPSSG